MADEFYTSPETEKKYVMSICAIFKNEALFLKDWIEYHLNIGVDHFYLYNVGSRDFYEKALRAYIRDDIVTLVNWPEAIIYQDINALKWALSTQIPAYENAANFLARDETKWLVFLDIDEFLVLPKGNIKILLNRYDEFPGIAFSSEFIDGAIYNVLSEKTLKSATFEMTEYPQEILEKSVSKVIFKPDQCKGFSWPPYQCRFKEFVSSFNVDQHELLVKRFINRDMIHRGFWKNRELKDDVVYPILFDTNEKRDRPIYQHIPQFLLKLGATLE